LCKYEDIRTQAPQFVIPTPNVIAYLDNTYYAAHVHIIPTKVAIFELYGFRDKVP